MEENNKSKVVNFLKTKWYYFVIGILAIVAIGYSSSGRKLNIANENIAKLEENIKELETENKELNDLKLKLDEKNESLETKLSDSESKLKESNKALDEKNKEIEELAAKATEPTEAPKAETSAVASTPKTQSAPATTGNYIANASTGKFHYASCSSVRQMNDSNKVSFSTREEAAARYTACKRCYP